jgi:hypothetical protein
VRLTRSAVFPRLSNFPADPNFRRRLKIVAAEYANGIKRLRLDSPERRLDRNFRRSDESPADLT